MIAQITGTLVRTEGGSVIIDANGVGYLIYVPVSVLPLLPDIGGKATLVTHLVVRGQPDMEMTLYGFLELSERAAFKILLGTSGVGPKVALALLSTLTVDELSRALSTSDTRTITKVPGVGPKLAQRMCLELGDKMAAFAFDKRTERAAAGEQTSQENAAFEDVLDALVGLGYSRSDARRAADRALDNAPDKANTSGIITSALALLTGGKRF